MPIQIHWQEGLFLQPHHLQRMQKSLREEVSSERRLGWAYPYGVIEARISRDELENFRVRFDRLRVIMPSGLEINYPENAELPSLDIKQAFSKGAGTFNLFLGVPLWQNVRANTLKDATSDGRVKLLYRVSEIECTDENTGENPKPIQVRKINSRLMFDSEDTADMELIPLLRVVRATGQELGLPREDPEYVPPCLVLSGSAILRELVRDLVAAVEATRKPLVVKMTRGGFSAEALRGPQLLQIMKLRTLNRFSARLPSIIQAPVVTPYTMYLELRELLGELVALHPDRDDFDCTPYNHESPYGCFRELSAKIRMELVDVPDQIYLKQVFQEVDGPKRRAYFNDEILTKPNAYLLGIKTKMDPLKLARYVTDPDKFKLMPKSFEDRAIRGVELKEERHAPMELPAASDLYYFRLDRTTNPQSAQRWQQVQTEKSATIRWQSNELDWSDAEFTLYATVPNTPGST